MCLNKHVKGEQAMKSIIFGALALAAAAQQAGAYTRPPDISSEYAKTYQINSAHTGSVEFSETFQPPFKKLWDKSFDTQLSYALVAEGNVYTVVGGTDLLAFDLATGKQQWEHVLSLFNNLGGYDAGQLFYVNAGGLMTALTAKTGKQNWAVQMPNQNTFNSPPVAENGMVFLQGGGEGGDLYGVDQAKGKVVWDATGLWSGPDGSPALGAGGVYVDSDCHFYSFDSVSGNLRWLVDTNGCSGGSYTSTYYKHRVYMKDNQGHYAFNTKKGKLTGSYSGDLTPSFFKFGKHNYMLTVTNVEFAGADIYCSDLKTGNVAWKFHATDGVWTPAVYASGYVIVGDYSGNVYVLDAGKGLQQWTTTLSHPINNVTAGQGAFVVSAWEIDGPPYPGEIAAFAPQ
jgi:outer membrane protein assembly factor BamB